MSQYVEMLRLKSFYCANCQTEMTFSLDEKPVHYDTPSPHRPHPLTQKAVQEHDSALEGTDISCDEQQRRLIIEYGTVLVDSRNI